MPLTVIALRSIPAFIVDYFIWSMNSKMDEDMAVTIRFFEPDAACAVEVDWQPTQQVMPRPDGSVDVHMTVSGDEIEGLVSWILSHGDNAKVISPQSLKDLVCERIEQVIQKYDEVDDD